METKERNSSGADMPRRLRPSFDPLENEPAGTYMFETPDGSYWIVRPDGTQHGMPGPNYDPYDRWDPFGEWRDLNAELAADRRREKKYIGGDGSKDTPDIEDE